MIRHELITPGGGVPGVGSIRWDLTAGTRTELDGFGAVVREATAPIVVEAGIEGMGHPTFETYGQSSPRVAGRRRTGTRAKERKCFLPVVFDELGEEWEDVQRLFWRCITPLAPITWRVTSPSGRVRELEATLDPAASSYEHDPSITSAIEALDLVADDPYWRGPVQTALLAVSGDGTPFFGWEGAPPFHLQPSSTNGEHRFVVDGDVEAWPVLDAIGPLEAWSVSSLGDGSTVGGLELLPGDLLRVDFDPTVQAAIRTRAGVESNVTAILPQKQFFRLIADALGGMDVATYVAGSGSVQLSYRPRYWRAT